MIKEDVLKIKTIIDNNKTKKIQTETKLESEYKYAKDNYECSTIDKIEVELDKMDANITKIESQIEKKSKTLEEAYDWNL